MILSLIAIESAHIRSLILGKTDETAWNVSLTNRRWTLSRESDSRMSSLRMAEACASLAVASTNGYKIFVS